MAFPDSKLDLVVEAAFGADRSADPLDWEWTDLSDRYRAAALRTSRGRPSEAGRVSPMGLSLALENLDGALTPEETGSPFYPNVVRGTPFRVWVEGATPSLYLGGTTGTYVETPDHASFDFAGDFDIRVRCQPHHWTVARTAQFVGGPILVQKGLGGGQNSWFVGYNDRGIPTLGLSTAGGGFVQPSSSSSIDGRIGDLRSRWIGWHHDADNGDTDGSWKAYTWHGVGDPPADLTAWDFVATPGNTTAGLGGPFASTSPVRIGASASVPAFLGHVDAVEIRDGLNGTLVADPDFTTAAPGAPSVTDSTGKVWTLNGDAVITTRRLRFAGTLEDLEIGWPHGDNRAGNPQTGSECWAYLELGGPLRSVQEGAAKPIESPIYRKVTTTQFAADDSILMGYWPLEVGEQATRAPGARPADDAADATLAGWTGQDTTLVSSRPLPSISGGETASWLAVLGSVTFVDNWAVTWLFRMPTPDGTYRRVMAVNTAGTAARWEVWFSSAGFRIRAVNGSETQLFQFDDPDAAGLGYTGWWCATLRAQQFGGNMSWRFEAMAIQDPAANDAVAAGSVAGTVGVPGSLGTSTTAPDGQSYSIGHVVVHDSFDLNWDIGWLNQAANGHIGETAAARFVRLCYEQNIPGEVIGDYFLEQEIGPSIPPIGDPTLSQAMGPQPPGKFVDVLQECATLDGGFIIERTTGLGLVYRTRADVVAAIDTVAHTLDAAAEGVRPGLGIRYDLERYRNQWEVTALAGGKAIAVDPTAAAAGLRDDSVQVNGVGGVNLGFIAATRSDLVALVGTQLDTIAAQLLTASTVPGPRARSISTELSIAGDPPGSLIPSWHRLIPGDRVDVVNLPDQWPISSFDLVLEGYGELWTPDLWTAELTAASPAAAWGGSPAPPASLAVVPGAEWEYAVGNATVTNPDPTANGNTVLAIALGQGTSNSPSITADPPSATGVTELTGLSVTSLNIRMRAWVYPNDGAASKAFGFSGGADNRCACILIPLDGAAAAVIEGGSPITGAAATLSFPAVVTLPGDLVIPIGGRRANSETPGTMTGYTPVDDDTADAVNPQGVAWQAVTASTPTTTPPDVTWSGSANTRVHAVVAFRPSAAPTFLGYTALVFDDFDTVGTYDGGAFGGDWEAYDSAGNAGFGLRRTSAVSIVDTTAQPLLVGDPPSSNGKAAQIAASWDGSNITSGLVQLTAEPITYGKVRFRAKATGDPSAQVSPVVLMWPDDDDWPGGGEVDIWEGIDAMDDLNPMKSFLHRENPSSPGNDQQLPALVWALPDIAYDALGTDWHTYELVWLPGQLIITVDDAQTQTMTLDPAWIPSVPMKFSIQLDAWGNSALSGPVYMWVDWVSIERADFA